MSLMTKDELKKHLRQLGIKVKGNYIRKKDIDQAIAAPKPDAKKPDAKKPAPKKPTVNKPKK